MSKSILKHSYQHWYTEYLHLSDTHMYLITGGVVVVALLSAMHPDFLKTIVALASKGAWTSIRKFIGRRWWRAGEGVWVGDVFIADDSRLRHTHILGATGTGKTVLLEHLIQADILRGNGVIIIDPKGDRKFYERIRDFCRQVGRERDLHLLSATYSEESCRWNPCALGTPDELQTKWFQSGVYDNPFYADACYLALIDAFNWLHEKNEGEAITLSDLLARLEQQALAKKNDHIEGLFNQLKAFALSEWGPLLCANRAGVPNRHQREITLWDIVRKNEILFVDLPTESKAIQSSRIGKLLLQEVTLLSGLRKSYPHLVKDSRPYSVYVDEFDAFATEAFGMFLNKGRSSNLMIHMAHQTIGDLERVSNEFAKVVVGNCDIHAIFRMNHPDEADFMARFIGTKTVTKQTTQADAGISTGRSSNRETEEYIVHPNRIKNLKIGECVLSMKMVSFCRVIRVPKPGSIKSVTPGPKMGAPAPTNPPRARRSLDQGADEYAGIMRETVVPHD